MPGANPGYGTVNLGTNLPTNRVQPIFKHNTNIRTWGNWLTAELHPEDDGACYGLLSAGTTITSGSMYFTELFISTTPLFQGYRARSFEWRAPRFRVPFIRYPEDINVGVLLPTVPFGDVPHAWLNCFKYRDEPI